MSTNNTPTFSASETQTIMIFMKQVNGSQIDVVKFIEALSKGGVTVIKADLMQEIMSIILKYSEEDGAGSVVVEGSVASGGMVADGGSAAGEGMSSATHEAIPKKATPKKTAANKKYLAFEQGIVRPKVYEDELEILGRSKKSQKMILNGSDSIRLSISEAGRLNESRAGTLRPVIETSETAASLAHEKRFKARITKKTVVTLKKNRGLTKKRKFAESDEEIENYDGDGSSSGDDVNGVQKETPSRTILSRAARPAINYNEDDNEDDVEAVEEA